jgi:hypothetical protein
VQDLFNLLSEKQSLRLVEICETMPAWRTSEPSFDPEGDVCWL